MKINIKARIFSMIMVFCVIMQTLAPIGVVKIRATGQETIIDVSKGVFEINTDTKQYKQGGDWINIVGNLVITGINNNPIKYKITGENPVVTYRDVNCALNIDAENIRGELTVNFESNNYLKSTPLVGMEWTGENYKDLTKVSVMGINDGYVDGIRMTRGNAYPATTIPIEVKNLNITGELRLAGYMIPIVENINSTNLQLQGSKLYLSSFLMQPEQASTIKNSNFEHIEMVCSGYVNFENVTNRSASASSSQSRLTHYSGTHNSDARIEIVDSNLNFSSISHYNINVKNSRLNAGGLIEMKGYNPTFKSVGSTITTMSNESTYTVTARYDFLTKQDTTVIIEDSSFNLLSTNWTINRFYNSNSKAKHDPINLKSQKLFLNKIKVPNNDDVQVSVSIDGRTSVNLWTNKDGYLHLYLTTGSHKVEITDLNNKKYSLEFEGSTVRESSLTSNIIGTAIPTSEDIEYNLSPHVNKEIEYSFDKISWIPGMTDGVGKITISVPKEIIKVYFRINGEIFVSSGQSPITKYAPVILGQSHNTLVQENGSITLFVLARPFDSGNSLTYQWHKDGEILSGEINSMLNISSVQKVNEGTYTCTIIESNGMSSNSNPITVNIGSVGAGVDEGVLEDLQNQISTLEGQLSQANADKITLQNTITNLNEQITTLNQTISSLNSQISTLQGMNEGLDEENEELLQQITELTQQLSDANSQISVLQAQISTLMAEKEGLSNQILTLESTITNLNQQISTLNLLLQGKEEENNDLKNTITNLNQQIQNLTEQVNTFLLDISNLEAQNTSLLEQITNLTSQNEDLLLQLSTLQGQLNAANIKISELEEKINEYAVTQAQLEGEKLALEQSNQTLLEQVDNLITQNTQLQAKVNQLQEQLDNANSQIENLQEEVATLESRIAELEGLLGTANAEKDSLFNQVQEHLQTITQLNLQITNLEELVALLSSETEDNEEVIKNLNIQITNLNSQVSNLQEEIILLKNEKAGLEVQVSDLQVQIASLNNTIITLTNRVIELEGINSTLIDNLIEANSKITNLEGAIAGLNEKISELEGNTTYLTNELVKAQNKLLEVNVLLDLIKGELGVDKDEDILPAIRELLEKLQQEKEKNLVLQSAIDKAIQDLNVATESNQQLQQKLQELEELLSNNENEELLQKLLELQEQLSNSKNKVKELEEERNTLQEQLNSSLEQLDLLKKKLEAIQENEKELEDKLIELETELDNLKKETESLEKSIENLEGESSRLVSENNELQIELKRLENLLDMANKTIEELQEMIKALTEENAELKKEKIVLSEEIENLKKNSNGPAPTPPTNDKLVLPSEESVIVSPIKDDKAETIINESTNEVITDKITAKDGWEVNGKLDENWKKEIDLVDVLKPNETEYTFFAREEDKPKQIYTIKVDVALEEETFIPTYSINKTIYLGSSYKIQTEDQKNGIVSFTSMDNTIATVSSDGTITPIKAGNTVIVGTVKADNQEYNIQVNVSIKEDGVTYNLKENVVQTSGTTPAVTMYKLLNKGSSTKVEITSNLEGATVNFVSSDPSIATVDSQGVIRGKKKGETTIITNVSFGNQMYTYITKVRITDGSKDADKWKYLQK